ncbi:hypothetical protein MIDIC_50064 [Alphaproteobacteria bacterium]
MKIEHALAPNSKDIDFLTQKINQETPEFSAAYLFAFFIQDKNNQIIAGYNGSVFFGALFIPINYRDGMITAKLALDIDGICVRMDVQWNGCHDEFLGRLRRSTKDWDTWILREQAIQRIQVASF